MPKRVGQATITLTPDFMVANLARDTIMGAVMSRAGFRPFVDSAKGMASRIKQDPAYREYLANGGGFASYLKDENTFRAHLDRFYTSKGINPKTVLDTPDKAMYFVETLADAFEMSTRLGEYPKIWEVGALSSLAERTVAKLNEQEPEYGKSVGRILTHLFNLNMMPQVVAPLYEQATNRNGFTNAPIETTGMENMQPFMRAKPTTSETLKAAGMASRDLPESMQVNPVRAEALLRGYFNTWGMYGLMLTDQAFFGDKLPEKRMDELPVVRRFYEADPVKHTKYESMFYDMLGEARRLHGTMRELDQVGRSEIADEIEKAPLSSKAKQLERASRNVSAINADMEEVRRSILTPAQKRAKLDSLTAEKNELLKATVLDVKSQGGGNAGR